MVTVSYANDEPCPVLRAPEYLRGILFNTDLTDGTDTCPMEDRRDQKVCCFPQAEALAA